jgi:heme-degrading monooxygenase HmoA
MATVVVTRLRVRTPARLPAFLRASRAAAEQAQRSPGYLGGGLRVERGGVFWTMTVWDSARSMAGFRDSGAHRGAADRVSTLAREATSAMWEQPNDAVPSWRIAGRRMQESADFAELTHASRSHRLRRPPRLRRLGLSTAMPPGQRAETVAESL